MPNNPQTTIRSTERSKLISLEAGRGVAALLVVLFHAGHHCQAVYGGFALGRLFAFGHAGVDFFFALSGFIIFEAHRNDIGNAKKLSHYVERRITRIYPIYWIILALTLLAVSLSSGVFPTAYYIVASFLLTPTREWPVMNDAWTLQHEMLFYTIFGLLILHRRLGIAVFMLWLAAIVIDRFVAVQTESGFLIRLLSAFNLEFFMGMGAAWLGRRWRIPAPRLFILAGIAAFFAIGAAEDAGLIGNSDFRVHLGYGAAATLAIIGLVAAERHHALVTPRILALLGGASYSLYLIHVLAIGAIWQIILHFKLDSGLPVSAVYTVLVVGAVVSGLLTNQIVEKPAIMFARRLFVPPRAAVRRLAE